MNKITGQQFKNAGDNSPSIWRRIEGKIITISIIFQVNCRNVRFFPREKIWLGLRDRINNTSDLEFVCAPIDNSTGEREKIMSNGSTAASLGSPAIICQYLAITTFSVKLHASKKLCFHFYNFFVLCCCISRTSKRFEILLDSRFV